MSDGDAPASPRRLVLEVLVLFVLLVLGTHAIYRGALVYPWMHRHAGDLQIALYFYLPLMPLLWSGLRLAAFGLAPEKLGSGVTWGFVTSVTVLPVFGALWWGAYLAMGSSIVPKLPGDLATVLGYQLAFVALPEELFFRGYAQARLDEAWVPRWSVFGARIGPGLLVSSVLFALLHPLLDDFWILSTWSRLEVFFPSLFFGWLRARTDSLAAPVIFHALCNVTLFTLQGIG